MGSSGQVVLTAFHKDVDWALGQAANAVDGTTLTSVVTGCPQGGINGCAEWLLCGVSQYLCVPYLKIIFHPPS